MNKTLEYTLRCNFSKALSEFDFGKVYKVMKCLDWSWWDSGNNPPSQIRMADSVRTLFEHSIQGLENTFKNSYCYSGGFLVRVWEDGNVEIQFIAENSRTY